MRSFGAVAALASASLAAADTLASCGTSTDHLKITSITTDADATGGPRKGEPFTITVEGTLDEAHQHGTVVGDLQVKALGIVNQDVPINQKYDFFPGIAEGPAKLVIGPFTFPRAVPGEVDVNGRITVVNENAEPVACLDVALKIPKILSSWSDMVSDTLGLSGGTCGDSTADHVQNVVSTTDVNGVTTTTADLDEDLDYVSLSCDLDVKVPLLPGVNLKIPTLPISLTPGIPQGQLKFVGYPSNASQSDALATVTGDLIISDKNSEEVRCVTFGGSSSSSSVVV